jgi:hypothetical protein
VLHPKDIRTGEEDSFRNDVVRDPGHPSLRLDRGQVVGLASLVPDPDDVTAYIRKWRNMPLMITSPVLKIPKYEQIAIHGAYNIRVKRYVQDIF